MRLTELTIENYGCYDRRTLTIPEEAGLTIIYGPNEAGKSTCLEAISDFLFTIPKNTPRGNLFGYDGMRLGASMRMTDGKLITLRRRKGNGKTLIDANGCALDEDALAPILGAITRERFTTLFGLDHESLRTGGDRLLLAEGDIGRLIVEAGGGLRTLVQRLEALDVEANALFTKTRAGSRAFYQGLAAYEEADKFVRANQLSRDAYEQTRKAADKAAQAAQTLREERRRLATNVAGLERILRVAPHLREREQLLKELAAYADAADYSADFSTRARVALAQQEEAGNALEMAIQRRDKLTARIASLPVSQPLAVAEKDIRAVSERALHVAKGRSDRANRQREIDEGEAQLAGLRRMLEADQDADLAEKLPEPAAIEKVRALAAEAIERAPSLTAAERRVAELTDNLTTIDGRIAAAKGEGFDTPLDIAASQFASLAAQKAGLEARQRSADAAAARLRDALAALDCASAAALADIRSPAPELVRSEQAAREAIKTQQVEQQRLMREAAAEIEAGEAEIASLQDSGRIATQSAIFEARTRRTALWAPIRTAFIEGQTEGTSEARGEAATTFEAHIADADDLADRRADGAERAASLIEAERRVARAKEKLRIAERELAALDDQVRDREAAFAADYPITAQHATLAGLLAFAERRNQLLELAEGLAVQTDEIAVDAAQLGPTIELLELAESRLGLPPSAGFAARVQALQAALARHEATRSDYQRDCRERDVLARQLKTATAERDGLRREQVAWEDAWPTAVAALGLPAITTPQSASAITTEWAGARGILTAIAQTRQRLTRMDEDEADLAGDVATLAKRLEIEIPSDPVAGAKMLQDHWNANEAVRVQHDSVAPDLEEAKVEVEIGERTLAEAQEALVGLAQGAGLMPSGLKAAADRQDERDQFAARLEQVERTAMEAGDRLSIAELIEQWAARDLDALRASLQEAQARSTEIDAELEAAILAEKDARDGLAAFTSESQVNRAMVERESASARMHLALERYLELSLARDLVTAAVARIRAEQQDPLIARAGALFAATTRGEFAGIETDIDEKGQPIVVGRRASGGAATVATMSDGTRDQLFLAFRLASLENYATVTEPLPFIADDILVHFDDTRTQATLELLASFGQSNQVLLFTHHRSVRDAGAALAQEGGANIVELEHRS
ncbi:MAG TPA: AAA family ATPase [Sphingomonas sp.]|nr:AAA family ATPase [Sphingomonas sp.]